MSTPDFVKAAPYGAYIFLGLMCVIGTAYIYFLVPETKQKTLDELDAVFGDNSGRSQWESQQLLQAQRDVGLLRLAGIEEKAGLHNTSDEGHFSEKGHDSGSETDVKKVDSLAVHTA